MSVQQGHQFNWEVNEGSLGLLNLNNLIDDSLKFFSLRNELNSLSRNNGVLFVCNNTRTCKDCSHKESTISESSNSASLLSTSVVNLSFLSPVGKERVGPDFSYWTCFM